MDLDRAVDVGRRRARGGGGGAGGGVRGRASEAVEWGGLGVDVKVTLTPPCIFIWRITNEIYRAVSEWL